MIELRWVEKSRVIPAHGDARNLVHDRIVTERVLQYRFQQTKPMPPWSDWREVPTVCDSK